MARPINPTQLASELPPSILAPVPRASLAVDPTVASLLSLLDDPSPCIWEPVFRELKDRGRSILGPLRIAARNDNPQLRARARALLESIERKKRLRRLLSYISRPRFHLETAAWLFSGLEMGEFDSRPFVRELDDLAELARGKFYDVKGDLNRALLLPNFLGDRFGFKVPKGKDGRELPDIELEYENLHPSKIFIHQVLAKRTGLPLSIAVAWKLVAFRLARPMELVGIPGHVLVRVPAGSRRILVDPCNGGRPVSRREVREYLEAYDIPFGPSVFQPMDDRAIMRRMVANYMKSLGMRGQFGRAEELLTLHALLDE
jgi:hypothetical protein